MSAKTAKVLRMAMEALQQIEQSSVKNAFQLRSQAGKALQRLGTELLKAEAVIFIPLECPRCRARMLTYNSDFNIVNCAGCGQQYGEPTKGVMQDEPLS